MEPDEKEEKKKRQQHDAWLRWYKGAKGVAYQQKLKEKRANKNEPAPESQEAI